MTKIGFVSSEKPDAIKSLKMMEQTYPRGKGKGKLGLLKVTLSNPRLDPGIRGVPGGAAPWVRLRP